MLEYQTGSRLQAPAPGAKLILIRFVLIEGVATIAAGGAGQSLVVYHPVVILAEIIATRERACEKR
jgi:hypothetical protein